MNAEIRPPLFFDRRDAGRRLASSLENYRDAGPVVIGLPRGGIPVAFEVASYLDAPLDVLVVRKLGAPMRPELGVGAIAEDLRPWLSTRDLRELGVMPEEMESIVARETEEVRRRVQRYRGDKPLTDLRGRTVLVVDDGVAMGVTMRVAVEAVRRMGAAKIVAAVPVGARDTLAKLRAVADDVVCLAEVANLVAIGYWYQDFSQTLDEEVISLLSLARARGGPSRRDVAIAADGVELPGTLTIPVNPRGLVLFAHGSGSSRHSSRNVRVASQLNGVGFATLLFDLLTEEESKDRRNVFDIELLGRRLACARDWARLDPGVSSLAVGYFGASTGAAAALVAAAEPGADIDAVVSRGGRPDLAGDALPRVVCPTLLIVGGLDTEVLELNRRAARDLRAAHLTVVDGATHLFEEPGALDIVAELAADWFVRHLPSETAARSGGVKPRVNRAR